MKSILPTAILDVLIRRNIPPTQETEFISSESYHMHDINAGAHVTYTLTPEGKEMKRATPVERNNKKGE